METDNNSSESTNPSRKRRLKVLRTINCYSANPSAESTLQTLLTIFIVLVGIVGLIALITAFDRAARYDSPGILGGAFLSMVLVALSVILIWALVRVTINISRNLFAIRDLLALQMSEESEEAEEDK